MNEKPVLNPIIDQQCDNTNLNKNLANPYYERNEYYSLPELHLKFEWDKIKADNNYKKHGIKFTEAAEIFADIYNSCKYDIDNSQNENRYKAFGVSLKSNYLAVAFTERSETIRIISARRMTNQDRNL